MVSAPELLHVPAKFIVETDVCIFLLLLWCPQAQKVIDFTICQNLLYNAENNAK
jgi:hypothetical protein